LQYYFWFSYVLLGQCKRLPIRFFFYGLLLLFTLFRKERSPANACSKRFCKSHHNGFLSAFQVPKGFGCTFFGAYGVTGKGSSSVAPLIAALALL